MKLILISLLAISSIQAMEYPRAIKNQIDNKIVIDGIYNKILNHLNEVAESNLWRMNVNDVFLFLNAGKYRGERVDDQFEIDIAILSKMATDEAPLYNWIIKNYKNEYKVINEAAIMSLIRNKK